MRRLPWVLISVVLAFPVLGGEVGNQEFERSWGVVNVPTERSSDAINIFGDLGKIFRRPNTSEIKFWWDRMVSGEVGWDRFLVLCALKDGNWKSLGDIRGYLDIHRPGIYSVVRLNKFVILMAGKPIIENTPRHRNSPKGHPGEGWLEKNRNAEYRGVNSKWRIEPSVLPMLFFLLLGCPEDNSCR